MKQADEGGVQESGGGGGGSGDAVRRAGLQPSDHLRQGLTTVGVGG